MSERVTVRPAAPEDVDAIVAIAASSALASHWERVRYEGMVSPLSGAAVQHSLLVAAVAGRLVGFAAARSLAAVSPAEVELENLAVLPVAQGGGVGGARLEAVLHWSAAMGAGPVRLEVRAANATALRLYRRHGFIQTGVRRGYYAAPPDDALCMERLLQ